MKKTKYLVLSAAAVLAVGCGSKQMPKIEDQKAITIAGSIDSKQAADFADVPDSSTGAISEWYNWKAPKPTVTVTATDSTNLIGHELGSPFYDLDRTATRTLKFDLNERRIQYTVDTNFYDADTTGLFPDYHPGAFHAQYDYTYVSGSGVWCCSSINGRNYKTLADWSWVWGDDYKVIKEKKDADAWMKYAYVYAGDLSATIPDEFVAPIPDAQHYICGHDDMMDYFINWGDGLGGAIDPYSTITGGWQGLINEDFMNDDGDLIKEFDIVDDEDSYNYGYYFDTYSQFVHNSLLLKKYYGEDFEKGEDFGPDSFAKADYFSDESKESNNLAGEVAYRLDYKRDAVVDKDEPAWSYGIDYSFNYADSYLTKSEIKYYVDEQYLTSKGAKSDYYKRQSATKSVNISYDKPNFNSIDLEDYTEYNFVA